MSQFKQIKTIVDEAELDELCLRLAGAADALGRDVAWPQEQLDWCGQYGVFRWFMPTDWHGFQWSEVDIIRGYLRLSAACLTTTFVITQRTGACRRIFDSDNEPIKQNLLADLASGRSFATVGISHLTTSRRHLSKPILAATPAAGGFLLQGMTPWVTGAAFAENLVVGATLHDGRQLLAVVPTQLRGVTIGPSANLIALNASCTGAVEFDRVLVPDEFVLAGPVDNVMGQGLGARTGGLQTSTLALGLARAALGYLREQGFRRSELRDHFSALQQQWQEIVDDLLAMAGGQPVCSNDLLRSRANSLVLRCAQSALMAAKGAGFVADHPAGRWCREALFFLVWSCPQPVLSANMCELAGIED